MSALKSKKAPPTPNGKKITKSTASSRNWKQEEFLKQCVRSGANLADALADISMSYDDLRYEIDSICPIRRTPSINLSDFRRNPNSIPVVSFFSGAGGLDLGFETAGYDHVGLVENNRIFCDTLRLNKPNWEVLGPPTFSGDVADFRGLADRLQHFIPKKFDGVFVGGPPCQPFSIAANQRFSKGSEKFKRVGFSHEKNGNLLFDYINLIVHFKPAVFLIENVAGLLDVDNGQQLKRAYSILEKAGYTINQPFKLQAANFGVPQQRVRLIIIGSRKKGRFELPAPVEKAQPCAPILSTPIGKSMNHVTREHSAESVLRYMKLDYGQRDQLGRVDRLMPNAPSKTVIAGGVSGGGRSHLHPFIPRTLSVRESARLQTFPDDYLFTGPVARQFTQVGNAVPPLLAAQLAIAIWESYY